MWTDRSLDDFEKDVAAVLKIAAIPSILDVVCESTGMGFAAVARVTDSRWVACQVLDNIHFGLEPGGELPVDTTICAEVRTHRDEVVIDHVAADPLYANHHTPAMYGFQSYISVPIVLPNGELFGTLCAIDPNPRKLRGTAAVRMFRLFAQLIAFHLDANQKLNDSRSDLASSQEHLLFANGEKELREQFIAVLGHDLRNPLAAIDAGTRMLANELEDQKSVRILRLMGESVACMSGLIDNLMDFARGRLGGGIALDLIVGQRIEPTLAQVINEMKSSHPDRIIQSHFNMSEAVDADHDRIAQMFSNLLGNAVSHGAHDAPITVDASVIDGHFELAVSNGGEPISPAAMKRLFQPFYRGELTPSMQGLGLGLYIASQIANAHGGALDVVSDPTQTRFTFRMPLEKRDLRSAKSVTLT